MYGQTQTHTPVPRARHRPGPGQRRGLRRRVHRAPESREEREAAEELTPLEFPPAPRKNTVEPPRLGEKDK